MMVIRGTLAAAHGSIAANTTYHFPADRCAWTQESATATRTVDYTTVSGQTDYFIGAGAPDEVIGGLPIAGATFNRESGVVTYATAPSGGTLVALTFTRPVPGYQVGTADFIPGDGAAVEISNPELGVIGKSGRFVAITD